MWDPPKVIGLAKPREPSSPMGMLGGVNQNCNPKYLDGVRFDMADVESVPSQYDNNWDDSCLNPTLFQKQEKLDE